MSAAREVALRLAEIGAAVLACTGGAATGGASSIYMAGPFLAPIMALGITGRKLQQDRRLGCVDSAMKRALVALEGIPEYRKLNLARVQRLLEDGRAELQFDRARLLEAGRAGAAKFLPQLREGILAAIPFEPEEDHLERQAVRHALTAALECLVRDKEMMDGLLHSMAMELLKGELDLLGGQRELQKGLSDGFAQASEQAVITHRKLDDLQSLMIAARADGSARPRLTITEANTVLLGWSGEPPGWADRTAGPLRAALDRLASGRTLTPLPCNLADLGHDLDSALWRPLAEASADRHVATVVHLGQTLGPPVPLNGGLRDHLDKRGRLARQAGERGFFDEHAAGPADSKALAKGGALPVTAPVRLILETLRQDRPLLVSTDADPDERAPRVGRLIDWLVSEGILVHQTGPDDAGNWADDLVRRIFGLGPAGTFNPFRKLDHYLVSDAARFFGREAEASAARDWAARALRDDGPPALRVEGPSGVGKSSFLHARVGAAAAEWGCVWVDFRPDDVARDPRTVFSPLRAFCARIDERLGRTTELEKFPGLRLSDPEVAGRAAKDWARRWATRVRDQDRRLLIGIDQFEELLDRMDQGAGRPWRVLLDFVEHIARREGALVAFTLESTRRPLLDSHLSDTAFAQAERLVLDGGEAFLQGAIRDPFRDAGLELAEDVLHPLIRDTLAHQEAGGSALPLLALKLHGLFAWLSRGPAGGTTPRRVALADLDGYPLSIDEEISDLAQQAWRDAGGESDEDLDIFLHPYVRLVADDGTPEGRIILQTVPARAFRTASQRQAAFVRRRLIVPAPGGMRLVHEAVLRHWPAAAIWLENSRPSLLRRAAWAAEAADWNARGRPPLPDPGLQGVSEAAQTLNESITDWALSSDAEIGPEAAVERAYALAQFDHARDPSAPVPKSPNSTLFVHLAASYGRSGLLERFAAADPASLALRRADGRTPLGQAAFKSEAAVQRLLELGADPNTADQKGYRPLDSAIWGGCIPAFDLLLPLTDPGLASPDIASPLCTAALSGEFALLRRLEERGFRHDAPAAQGFTALMGAAWGGDQAIFAYCLERGDPCLRAESKLNTLDVLAWRGDYKLIQRLLYDPRGEACLEPDPKTGLTALHHAAAALWPKTVRELLGLGLDPNAAVADGPEKGRTPLHRALGHIAGKNPTEVPRHLLDRCAETVTALLESDRLDVNTADAAGRTVLVLAERHPALCERIMEHPSFRPDAMPPAMAMPLDRAIASDDRDRVAALLMEERYRAVLMRERPGRVRPVEAMLDRGMQDLVRDLIASGHLNPWQVWQGEIGLLERACWLADPALLSTIRGQLDGVPSSEQGLAIMSARCGFGRGFALPRFDADGKLTEVWLAAGSDREVLAAALDMALQTGHADLAARLERAGADLNRVDDWGRTPRQRGSDRLAGIEPSPFPPDQAFPEAPEWSPALLDPSDPRLPPFGPRASVKARALSFHAGARLLMLCDPDADVVLPLYFAQTAKTLNPVSNPPRDFSTDGMLSITDDNVLDYLRFFCFFLRAERGPFPVLESLDSRLWPAGLRDHHPDAWARIGERFQAPRLWGREAEGRWRISAMVGHSAGLFLADFLVHANGEVKMVRDVALINNLPFAFDAPIRTA